MRSGFLIAAFAFFSLGLPGCGSDNKEHAAQIGDCKGKDCAGLPGGGVGGAVPGVGSGGSNGGGTDAGTNPGSGSGLDGGLDGGTSVDAGSMALTGTVEILSQPDFSTLSPLGLSQVEISASSSRGGLTTTTYDGSTDFTLPHIDRIKQGWVGVSQVDGTQPLMNTLQLLDLTKRVPVSLVIVDRSTLEEVAGQGSLSTPVQLQEDRGHTVLTFVDKDAVPLDNIKVTSTTGTTVAYDAGPTYSDVLEATSNRGSILILNMGATAFPGSVQTVSISRGSKTTNLNVQVASNTISVATFVINP